MKKLYAIRNIFLLAAVWLPLCLYAQNVIWETNFGSEEAFRRWTVVDANADGVTWGYEPGLTPSPVVYRYHYANSGDDWLISPAITVPEAAQLMVKYEYVGSFYSEEMEVYRGSAPIPDSLQRVAVHTDLKDKEYASHVFFEVEAGETFYLAFRATSPAYKQQLFLTSVQVVCVGSNVANDYPNRVASASGLTLASIEKYVEAGKAEEVNLAVFDGTADVTSDAKIYVCVPGGEEIRIKESHYICTEVGEYRFYAIHEGKSSADAPLSVQALHRIPVLLPDEQPESEDFLRRVLLLQGTGVHCSYCPNGIAALWRFFAEEESADRVCHIAHHSYYYTDPLYCEAAEIISSQTELNAYPNMMVNFNKEWGTTGLSEDGFVYWLNEVVGEALEGTSSTNIALSTVYDAETDVVSVNVGVKVAEPGLYRVTVALLQDSVYSWQSGAPSEDYYIHNGSVRALSPRDGEGAYLDGGSSEKPGRIYQYACEFDANALVQDKHVDNAFSVERQARVVAYVKRVDGLVDNVVACAMNGAVGFAYTSVAPEVPPVGIRENCLDAAVENLEVEIYDFAGSLRTIKQGTDFRTWKLPRGVYLVREKRGDTFSVKKVFVP